MAALWSKAAKRAEKYLNTRLKSVCRSADIRKITLGFYNESVLNSPQFFPVLTSEFTGNKDNNNIKAALSPIFLRFRMSGFMNMCVYVCVCAGALCSIHFPIIYIGFNAISPAAWYKFPSFLSSPHKLSPPLLICPATQSPFIMIALP